MSLTAMYLKDGYKGQRNLTGWYRDLTVLEAKRLTYGTLYAIDRNGNVRECRLNGKPKTWKTRPGCELSLKYGLKEYFQVGGDSLSPMDPISLEHNVRIVVPVKVSFEATADPGIVADWCKEHEAV